MRAREHRTAILEEAWEVLRCASLRGTWVPAQLCRHCTHEHPSFGEMVWHWWKLEVLLADLLHYHGIERAVGPEPPRDDSADPSGPRTALLAAYDALKADRERRSSDAQAAVDRAWPLVCRALERTP